MDALARFLRRLVRVVGYVAAVSLVVGLSYRSNWVWRLYERHLDLSYATNKDDWQYISVDSDVQWRRDEPEDDRAPSIIYRRILGPEQVVHGKISEDRFIWGASWKAECTEGETLRLPLIIGGKSGTQTEIQETCLKCRKRDGSTWFWTGRTTSKPVSIELNISGFYVKEDFTHPRWGGFVEGQRLDAIETARRAISD